MADLVISYKDCSERKCNCHSVCEKYIIWKFLKKISKKYKEGKKHMTSQLFCKHKYYFFADMQRTYYADWKKDTKETVHCIYIKCIKCNKEKQLKSFITTEEEVIKK